MRLTIPVLRATVLLLLLAGTLPAGPLLAQQAAAPPSPSTSQASSQQDSQASQDELNLPVSLDWIKKALEAEPPIHQISLRSLDEQPTFRVAILERQKIEELLATLDFKTTPTPAGGVYWNEVQRQMWPSVDNPLVQPYAAFGQGELLTVAVENLVGQYLAGKAVGAIGSAVRAHAESAAREEVRQAIRDYCAAQPNGGAGIAICSS